jgi:sodium-dependent dicarboxylate transporter 2/3/5
MTSRFESLDVPRIGRWLGPVLFLLLLVVPTPDGMSAEGQRLLAVTALMSTFWLTQAMPIAATSLIPIVAFPFLGIQTSDVVSQAFINKQVFLFLGGFIIALGIERWGLHERLALHIVRVLGTSLKRVILGFMLATAFLSMWISNTASTLLMTPIGIALVVSLQKSLAKSTGQKSSDKIERDGPLGAFAISLMLGIAWSASVGGMTTLVGTVTNVQFQAIWEKQFPLAPELSAGDWLIAFGPVGLAMLFISWWLLTWNMQVPKAHSVERSFFTSRLKELGKPTKAEWAMLAVFLTTAFLWTFRKPLSFGEGGFQIPGWQSIVNWMLVEKLGATEEFARKSVHDSTVAVMMALVMFVIPVGKNEDGKPEFLMDWETAQRLPWAILLLVGGGLAIAGAFKETGLAEWVGGTFAASAEGWPVWVLILGICLLMTFLTEFATNMVIVTVMLPVLADAALQLQMDPRVLMLPATVSASCAFMLPIGTPPNAIVFSSGVLTMSDMAKRGFVLNLVGVIFMTLATWFYLVPALGLSSEGVPEWAEKAPVAEAAEE